MDLDEALRQFDIVKANLVKVDAVLGRMTALAAKSPGGHVSGSDPHAEYVRLRGDFERLLGGLPSIDGWCISLKGMPEHLDTAAVRQLAGRRGDHALPPLSEPAHLVSEYRTRLGRKRRQLVRARLEELVAQVDQLLDVIGAPLIHEDDGASVRSEEWDRMERLIDELDRLFGGGPRPSSWSNLRRHLGFAKGCDYFDIRKRDWPTVKSELQHLAYDDAEPIPVAVADMEIVASRPSGVVSTALKWAVLDEEDFERLIYTLISNADGYENPAWLTKTRASDRGRDLSVHRGRTDSLSGVTRERVILQCKHWQAKSVADTDVSNTLAKMSHWEPPLVDVLVVVTSGCFTDDAVRWIENHNHQGKRPRVESWAKSHLEHLLAKYPEVAVGFGLR